MSPARSLSLTLLLFCAACKPPASDDYVSRIPISEAETFASDPLPSPDVTGAVWAESGKPLRILYGVPGKTPYLALYCDASGAEPQIVFTRFSPADREAQAVMALIGNGHIERVPVAARNNGRAWLWQGGIAAKSSELNALTGSHNLEVTIPGAGSLIVHPSRLPETLINACEKQPTNAQLFGRQIAPRG